MDTGNGPVAWTEAELSPRREGISVPHRLAASLLLAIGLLAAGGAAMVNAASPDPSASAAPNASAGAGGSGGTQAPANNADCPNM